MARSEGQDIVQIFSIRIIPSKTRSCKGVVEEVGGGDLVHYLPHHVVLREDKWTHIQESACIIGHLLIKQPILLIFQNSMPTNLKQ